MSLRDPNHWARRPAFQLFSFAVSVLALVVAIIAATR